MVSNKVGKMLFGIFLTLHMVTLLALTDELEGLLELLLATLKSIFYDIEFNPRCWEEMEIKIFLKKETGGLV